MKSSKTGPGTVPNLVICWGQDPTELCPDTQLKNVGRDASLLSVFTPGSKDDEKLQINVRFSHFNFFLSSAIYRF